MYILLHLLQKYDMVSNDEYVETALAQTQHPTHAFMRIHRPGDPEIKVLGNVPFTFSMSLAVMFRVKASVSVSPFFA
jgi:hypothetical protein